MYDWINRLERNNIILVNYLFKIFYMYVQTLVNYLSI